jgi:hypothetical protein
MILVYPQVSLGQFLCSTLRSELGRSTGFTRFRADFLPVLVKGSCEARRGTTRHGFGGEIDSGWNSWWRPLAHQLCVCLSTLIYSVIRLPGSQVFQVPLVMVILHMKLEHFALECLPWVGGRSRVKAVESEARSIPVSPRNRSPRSCTRVLIMAYPPTPADARGSA